MIRRYHNHKLQTNPWHREEEPHNNHETPGRQTKKSNQLSHPMEMIAKLEWTQSNVQQNIEQLQTPTMGVTTTLNQHQQNHRLRTGSSKSLFCEFNAERQRRKFWNNLNVVDVTTIGCRAYPSKSHINYGGKGKNGDPMILFCVPFA